MPSEPLSIFFSYSRKDQDLMQDLASHLEPLRRSQLIHHWHDGCIGPGKEWEPQIKENLEKAQIILLLVSVDFINSDYCYTVELSRAIARHKAGTACVIPVILRSCLWKHVPVGDMRLGDLQALPKDAKPIRQWADLDAAYTSIAEGLYDKIQQLRQEQAQAEYYNSGLYHLAQGNYDQAMADFAQAVRLGHPQASEQMAEIERKREEAERQLRSKEYYDSGCNYFDQGNYDQAIADFTQAAQMGHPWGAKLLAEAKRRKQANQDDLSSEKGIDYTRLRNLLKAGKWREAD